MPAGDAGRPYGTPAEENAWDVANELRTENDRLQAQVVAMQVVIEGFIHCAEQRYWPSAERIEEARRALAPMTGPAGDAGLDLAVPPRAGV